MYEVCGNGVYFGMFCCVVKYVVELFKFVVVDDDDDVFVVELLVFLFFVINGIIKGL